MATVIRQKENWFKSWFFDILAIVLMGGDLGQCIKHHYDFEYLWFVFALAALQTIRIIFLKASE